MATMDGNNKEHNYKEAVRQFVEAHLKGAVPDIEELVNKYPEYEHEIRQKVKEFHKVDSLFDSLVQADESDFEVAEAGQNLVGQKIGSFEIEEIIGRGGMGVVYLARDTKLERSVAIKSMPAKLAGDSTAQMRFHREAKLLASLNHPNIAVIHDIIEQDKDLSYLILEYVPGESLAQRIARGPLKLEQAFSIARQIAQAVSAAHEKGVVHRDLKPGNIKITPEGKVKVLDFGLAKASVSEGTDIEITSTEPGHIIGTPAYMSPEQARGNPTDHRTDIWSFGCIIYQMLTGHSPFESDTATDTLARIIESQPDWELLPNETPENIRVLLRRCVEKDPDQRLRDIGDAAIEISETLSLGLLTLSRPATTTAAPVRILWRWATAIGLTVVAIVVLLTVVRLNIDRWREQLLGEASPGRIKSLAVLPLEYRSGEPNQEYYADAMTDELIACLSKIGTLRVISRQSVMQYKESDKPLPQIARELGVDAVVEGTMLCGAEQVRITAQLIGAVPERNLWGDSYDRDFGDIVILSSEVARAIAREIKVVLTPTEQALLTSARPVNPEAYELYRRGMYHRFKFSKEGSDRASECFREAIKVDPGHARAYVGLANCYGYYGFYGHIPVKEAYSEKIKLVNIALEIDESLAEAHDALAVAKFYYDWDWAGAEEGFKRALEFNPNLVGTNEYAWFLMAVGRFDEAIAEAERTLRLDPFTGFTNATLGEVYTYARQDEKALAQWQLLLDLGLNDRWAYSGFARVYELMGEFEDFVKFTQKTMELRKDPPPPEDIEAFRLACSESGPTGYWRWRLDKLKGQYDNKPTDTAICYAQLGDKDQAFAWLEKAYEKHDMELFRLKYNTRFDPLRDDPRFGDLLSRMNFPE